MKRERKIKFDAERRTLYLEFIRRGLRLGAAAKAVGVCRDTVFDYCRNNPEFQKKIDDAEAEAAEVIENVLFAKAGEGERWAVQMWLHNRAPERWKDRRQPQVQITTQPAATDLAQVEADLLEKLKEVPNDDR